MPYVNSGGFFTLARKNKKMYLTGVCFSIKSVETFVSIFDRFFMFGTDLYVWDGSMENILRRKAFRLQDHVARVKSKILI